MSEETVAADKTAAMGIVLAVGCSALAGLMYILALMFSVQVSPETGAQVEFVSAQDIWIRDRLHPMSTTAGTGSQQHLLRRGCIQYGQPLLGWQVLAGGSYAAVVSQPCKP
jgi:hypothetical protein